MIRQLGLILVLACAAFPQAPADPIATQLRGMRKLPDGQRARVTKELAIEIRRLPAGDTKLQYAWKLANLSTEGDFGHDALQEVATTLAQALREHPLDDLAHKIPPPYQTLASLVRYEHVTATLDDRQFRAAMKQLESDDQHRASLDFTLTDLNGKNWSMTELRGKVVLVNFWATWCPPCRKEMPDLEALYQKFRSQGFVVLAISDELEEKVRPFVAEQKITYPVLLDPGRKITELFRVDGIPKNFVYGRDGRLVAQSIDMRTRGQFLQMLKQAGLK